MAQEIDKDILATLTEEEIEAINAEPSPDEFIVMRQQKEADALDDDEELPEVDDADVVAAEPATTAPATTAPATATNDEPAPAPAPAAVATTYQINLPADFADQLAAVNAGMAELVTKFKEGDLDFDAYNEQLSDLAAKREELGALKTKADVFTEMNAQNSAQAGERAANAFMDAAAKNDGIDYRKDKAMFSDLTMFVERLELAPGNEGKSLDWLMAEAHKRVMALNGVEAKAVDPAAALKAAKQARKTPTDSIPKTLAQVPGGDGPGDLQPEFSDIDSLEGVDIELAIARMTPAQRERYSRGL